MASVQQILNGLHTGDTKSLARALTIVENNLAQSSEILRGLQINPACAVTGITGPPGAGKSTLVNALINSFSGKRIAVLAVDPTSPFNFGSLLGDRIRMSEQFVKSNVFIRSIATRGSLGGLSVKTMEMCDVLRAAGFDHILVETVGVGQSEVEIAGLADLTVVVLVPEAGDEIQHIKSGLMEIADIFVVNKSDREGADTFANNIRKMVHHKAAEIPVINTVAESGSGIAELADRLQTLKPALGPKKELLLAEKAYHLIREHRMADIDKDELRKQLQVASAAAGFNMYRFVDSMFRNS